jgi:hypothetical protein
MQKGIVTIIGLAGLGLTLTASAAYAGPFVNRAARQGARIQHGVATGQLTPRETRFLNHEQQHIQTMRQHALADGQVGPREAAKLTVAQDKASRNIHRLDHNNRQVPPAQ